MCCDDSDFWRSDVSTSDEEETDGTESREGDSDIVRGARDGTHTLAGSHRLRGPLFADAGERVWDDDRFGLEE